jgi:hypothetical protein
MHRPWLAVILAGALILSLPVWAQAPSPAPNTPMGPREHLEEATRQILRMLEQMMQRLPQYETPEVLENGDIIIRRKRPRPPPTSPESDPDRTKT